MVSKPGTWCEIGLLGVSGVLSVLLAASVVRSAEPLQIAQQPDPNRDRLIQPSPPPTPLPPAQTEPVLPQSPPVPVTPPADTRTTPEFLVKRIEVEGSSLFRRADLESILSRYEGRSLTLEQLRQAADEITQQYLDRGYITSRAIVPEQTITDGTARIQVIEGRIEEIQVLGTDRLASYVRSRIGLGARTPLNRDQLEDQLRLLKADPLFTNVEASLRSGTQPGQSILIVRVTESPPLSGFVGVDNFSPPSVGPVRLGGGILYRNLAGLGDELFLSYFRTTVGGANNYEVSYRVPVSPSNGTVQVRYAPNDNRIVDPQFADLDIQGESELYEITYRQPLMRTPREEFALSIGFTVQNGQTFLFQNIPFPFGIGPDAEGNSKTRVLKFGQDYVRRDLTGAWALRSQFNLGLGIFDATDNPEPTPDGEFISWLGQVQRVQRLGNNQLLIVQADVQLTPDSLLPSQQFVIGGGQSLRGFRQNARSGDSGFRLSIEDRIAIYRDESGNPTIQVAPFFDMGAIWFQSDNPTPRPEQRFLAGVGLGLLWQPFPGMNVRLDYAVPLIELDDRGNDAQDEGFYFSVIYTF